MAFGTPGGDVQQQAMLQVLLNITAFGMPPQQAVEAPAAGHAQLPRFLLAARQLARAVSTSRRASPHETRAALASLGHVITDWPDYDWRAGAVCASMVGKDGVRLGGADPRRGAHAIGW